MSKYFLNLVFYLFLILNKESFAGNDFDIEAVSDSIVGELWRKAEVPQEDIKELFTLIKEDPSKENEGSSIDKEELSNFIGGWRDSIIYILEQRERSTILNQTKQHLYIEDFVNKVRSLEKQFSPQVIKESLEIILSKY